ncbi:unnamed protein product [Staurois parvus]|uniref:Uncharacterized protein n=1 Tax=Staurois parvus TaxID=386267 RepID=A0ABN9ESD9_9NEOB|nr:unnamed protein product [Staurois parvus]
MNRSPCVTLKKPGADWQLMGPPGNRGSCGPCVLTHT